MSTKTKTTAWRDVRAKRPVDASAVSEHVARMEDEERAYRLREIREEQGVTQKELADRMAVRLWGAQPAARPGERPQAALPTGIPLYHCIVPVPPHQAWPGMPGLPLLLARRLGAVLGVPVVQALRTRRSAAQKQLGRAGRMQNAKNAYACRPGTDLSGKRVLLVDDIITTGATASACALALLQAGASDVTAAAIAAVEELPRQQRIDTEKHT